MADDVVLIVNGSGYGGWKGVTVSTSVRSFCGAFEFSASDKWPGSNLPRGIREGDECQVLLGDEPVITGYVDGISPAFSESDCSLGVRGRDKTCDLVDCSAELESYEIWGQDLAGIARELCGRFGIELKIETPVGAPFLRFSVQPGEKAYACLDRAAKLRGVVCSTDGFGALVLSAKNSFKKADDRLVEGKNIKSAAGDYNWSNRYSLYRVFGQMPAFNDGVDEPLADLTGEARDANVMRYRPLFLSAEAWTDPESATTRAKNECAKCAGESTRVNVQVTGWRQTSGALWRSGLSLNITSPRLYLDNEEMIVTGIRYSESDDSGQIAELELTRRDAFLESGEGEVEKDPYD